MIHRPAAASVEVRSPLVWAPHRTCLPKTLASRMGQSGLMVVNAHELMMIFLGMNHSDGFMEYRLRIHSQLMIVDGGAGLRWVTVMKNKMGYRVVLDAWTNGLKAKVHNGHWPHFKTSVQQCQQWLKVAHMCDGHLRFIAAKHGLPTTRIGQFDSSLGMLSLSWHTSRSRQPRNEIGTVQKSTNQPMVD